MSLFLKKTKFPTQGKIFRHGLFSGRGERIETESRNGWSCDPSTRKPSHEDFVVEWNEVVIDKGFGCEHMCIIEGWICIYHLSIFLYVSVCSSSFLTWRTTVTCNILYVQYYLFTVVIYKFQMWSSQFNFTRTFLNSFVTCFLGLTHLLHLLENCLRSVWIDCLYVCRVCFDCVSPSDPDFRGKRNFAVRSWHFIFADVSLCSCWLPRPYSEDTHTLRYPTGLWVTYP